MIRHVTIIVAAWLLLSALLAAQTQPHQTAPVGRQAPRSFDCSYNFSSGDKSTFVSYCVTVNGNVLNIVTPLNAQQSFASEGYGICNESPATAYWDYAREGDSGSWGAATLLSQTATTVKIARTTVDGIWTLTQTIALDKATPGVKVVMAIKNNSTAPRVVYLVRYIDGDADSLSAGTESAFDWNQNSTGLEMRNIGQIHFGYLQGFARTTSHPPNPCNFAGESSGTPLSQTDGSEALAYVDTVGAKMTKTATIVYRGM